jgi:hypothetical protein
VNDRGRIAAARFFQRMGEFADDRKIPFDLIESGLLAGYFDVRTFDEVRLMSHQTLKCKADARFAVR